MALVPMMLVSGLAVDVGLARVRLAEVQVAADSAALAAVSGLYVDEYTAVERAIAFAATNQAGGRDVEIDEADIQFGDWDQERGVFELTHFEDADAVRIVIEHDSPAIFSQVVGFEELSGTREAIAWADDAKREQSDCGFYGGARTSFALSHAITLDAYDSDLGEYDYDNSGLTGAICSNGDIDLGGDSVTLNLDLGAGEDVYGTRNATINGAVSNNRELLEIAAVDCSNVEYPPDSGVFYDFEAMGSSQLGSIRHHYRTNLNGLYYDVGRFGQIGWAMAYEVVPGYKTLRGDGEYPDAVPVWLKDASHWMGDLELQQPTVMCVGDNSTGEGGRVRLNGEITRNFHPNTDTRWLTVLATDDIGVNTDSALYGSLVSNESIDFWSYHGRWSGAEFYGFVAARDQLYIRSKFDLHMDQAIARRWLTATIDRPPPLHLVR